jgi:hypothetical protein
VFNGGQVSDLLALHVKYDEPNDCVAVEATRRVQVLVLEPIAKHEYHLSKIRLQLHIKFDKLGVFYAQTAGRIEKIST